MQGELPDLAVSTGSAGADGVRRESPQILFLISAASMPELFVQALEICQRCDDVYAMVCLLPLIWHRANLASALPVEVFEPV